MLVATGPDGRVDAALAIKGQVFHCPNCLKDVTLRRGRIRVAHFAHKTERDCSWAKGETLIHIGAKRALADGLKARGLRVEIEYPIPILEGDRRADVATWSPNGRLIAFELQHTSIDLDDIERRSFAYASADILQCWIPVMRSETLSEAVPTADGTLINPRFIARRFERWVHGFYGKHGMWMYDPAAGNFWLGRISAHKITVDPKILIIAQAFKTVGGYERQSKLYRQLTLQGPHRAEDLRISIHKRWQYRTGGYRWPTAPFAGLTPASG